MLNLFAAKAGKAGLDLLYDIDENVPVQLIGDNKRLREVLMNLVENAVKFTQRGEILLSVHSLNNDSKEPVLSFEVRDSGIGMSQEEMSQLFYNVSGNEFNTDNEKTGAGLIICRKQVELMGGKIEVTSKAGKGTTFTFNIPLSLSQQSVRSNLLLENMTHLEGKQVLMRIRDLNKKFGPRHILRGIDLDVYKGETLVIIGGSGSGKTTLIRHLMGFLVADAGSVSVGNLNLNLATPRQIEEYRKRLGVVFQMAALLNSLTVLENVGLPLIEVDRLPVEQVRSRVIAALKAVFLPAEEILHLKPASLSGGMRKRVGIARAIIQKPEIILYDEPTTGLDPVTVNGVNELTLELQRTLGVTSLVITHDLAAAFMIADRIAMLYKGRMIAVGTKEQIQANQHPVLQQMLTGSTKGPLTEGYGK